MSFFKNQASDLWQMFSVMCDIVIHNNHDKSFTYIAGYPCSRVHLLQSTSGHRVTPQTQVTVVVLEYGRDFSGEGKNPFEENRAISDVAFAHRSNFLHPVFYHYNSLFDRVRYLARPSGWILPLPDEMMHLVEDFLTKFKAPQTHSQQLRRFFEKIVGGLDLRAFYAEECFQLYMTSSKPISCNLSSVTENEDLSSVMIDFPSQFRLKKDENYMF